jgi:ribosome-associated protein
MTEPSQNHREKKTLLPVAALPQSEGLSSSVTPEQLAKSLEMAKSIVKAAAENRGQEILLLDLTGQTSLFDFFVIATGSSRRQLAAMSTEIDRVMKYELHEMKLSVAGYEESRWIVLDYGSIVVHLFDEETREYYDLESLWADGKPVDIADIVSTASAQMTRINDVR